MANWRRQLGLHGELVGIGIDRIDYTKGIRERLRALDRFLGKYPEYRGRLVFIQVGVPSRTRIREYKLLEEEIGELVEEINWKWASGSWRPIVFIPRYWRSAAGGSAPAGGLLHGQFAPRRDEPGGEGVRGAAESMKTAC